MSENTEDRKYMGTKNEAEAKLIAASRAWRETRQPMMGTRADLNANDVAERELRFCLANAALLWLWHQENPDPVLSPVPISSEKMELAQRIEVGLATEVDGSFSPLNREQWIMIVAALRASSPAQEPVTTEPVGYQWRFKSHGRWSKWINMECDLEAFEDLQTVGLKDGRIELRAIYPAIPAPPVTTEPVGQWYDGAPKKPWSLEWFIAETTVGDRVCLVALPDDWTYDFKTADDTYIKRDKIKRWMPFPDSEYIPPDAIIPAPPHPGREWLPIAEAPKDGLDFLALMHDGREPPNPFCAIVRWNSHGRGLGRWMERDGSEYHEDAEVKGYARPLGWMPLPALTGEPK
jgi:PAS domain-containing protein